MGKSERGCEREVWADLVTADAIVRPSAMAEAHTSKCQLPIKQSRRDTESLFLVEEKGGIVRRDYEAMTRTTAARDRPRRGFGKKAVKVQSHGLDMR